MPTDVGPGEALFVPREAVHRFDNNGEVDASALAIVTPGNPRPGLLPRYRGRS
jgi:mannose-6-phosphate isomerase-like protein (cupin superfamily)